MSTDLVTLDEAAVEAALRGELAQDAQIAIADPIEVAQDIVRRILEAGDPEQVFSGGRAVGGREALGRPFILHGVRWHRSAYAAEGGLPIFAVLDATFVDTGERVAITTGAVNVMAQVFALARLDALPVQVKIEESDRPTAAGYRPQWLQRA